MRGEVIDLVERLGLAEKVTVSGVRSDLWGVMKAATALVSPSLFEGQPNVVLEAAAAGCPLVLSDIKAHRDVADESSAIFFRPDSPAELAGALLATLRDPAAASRRAAHALRMADGYSVGRAVTGYQSIYDQLLVRYR
jgi:glycosyltransferase involved in cell wall biosynthesis